MTGTAGVLTVAALALIIAPASLLDVAGADQIYERDLLRYCGALLLLLAGLDLHARRRGYRLDPDGGPTRAGAVVLALAVMYVVSQEGVFLVLAFAGLAGLDLNLAMRAVDYGTGRSAPPPL